MTSSSRLFNCARCHALRIICRECDHGQRYCPFTCCVQARRDSQRRAARRYQKTRRGRHVNAERQRRYRERQRKKVTHHGSLVPSVPVVLPARANKLTEPVSVVKQTLSQVLHCHFCQRPCSSFLRRDFLCSSSRRSAWRRSAHEPG